MDIHGCGFLVPCSLLWQVCMPICPVFVPPWVHHLMVCLWFGKAAQTMVSEAEMKLLSAESEASEASPSCDVLMFALIIAYNCYLWNLWGVFEMVKLWQADETISKQVP